MSWEAWTLAVLTGIVIGVIAFLLRLWSDQ